MSSVNAMQPVKDYFVQSIVLLVNRNPVPSMLRITVTVPRMQFRLLKKAIKVGLALWYLAGWAVTWLRVVPSQLTRKRA